MALPKTHGGKEIAHLKDWTGAPSAPSNASGATSNKFEECHKTYYTHYKGRKDLAFWCGDCVRGDNPDPRVIWCVDARDIRKAVSVRSSRWIVSSSVSCTSSFSTDRD
jgi:hypothetical protein